MCLLTYLRAGVLPDTEALLAGAEVNSDGHGFAIVDNDRLIVHRGLDGPRVVAAFQVLRDRYRSGPAVFHSRLATHGDRDIDNCHPLVVGGDRRTVIAHNGILPPVVRPAATDPRSDTRITAEEFLPAFGPLHQRRVRLRFARWMTAHNLMVLLTVDPRFDERGYIFHESAGIWEDGIWYSNDGYRPAAQSWWGVEAPGWDGAGPSRDRCGFCHAILDSMASCPWCGWCPDCGEMPEDCQCYTPATYRRFFGERRIRP